MDGAPVVALWAEMTKHIDGRHEKKKVCDEAVAACHVNPNQSINQSISVTVATKFQVLDWLARLVLAGATGVKGVQGRLTALV